MLLGCTTGSVLHLSIFLPSLPPVPVPILLSYCGTCRRMRANTHTLTFVITVITKQWNEVIFLFPNNRLSKQQMNLLPPAMRNRHIIFKFQFIFSWRLFPLCGCHSHNNPATPTPILLAVRQWDIAAVCQKGLIFRLSSSLLENVV